MKLRSVVFAAAFILAPVAGNAQSVAACNILASRMVGQIQEGKGLDCGMNDAWSTSRDYWTGKCLNNGPQFTSNRKYLEVLINQCRKNAAAKKSAGPQAVANSATDVYTTNDGNGDVKCTMNAGDSGKFVGKKQGEANWVGVTKITGDCNGKSGWVWDGGTLDIK